MKIIYRNKELELSELKNCINLSATYNLDIRLKNFHLEYLHVAPEQITGFLKRTESKLEGAVVNLTELK